MAFNASSVSLEVGLRSIRELALNTRNYLGQWNTMLASNITAIDALNMLANLDRIVPMMDTWAALPGMATYAQAQLGGAAYDIVAEYTTMKNSLDSIRTWLRTNIPSNAITVTSGVQVGATYAPAVTAPLKTLVVAAIATIS